jgi:hypothetical protein
MKQREPVIADIVRRVPAPISKVSPAGRSIRRLTRPAEGLDGIDRYPERHHSKRPSRDRVRLHYLPGSPPTFQDSRAVGCPGSLPREPA